MNFQTFLLPKGILAKKNSQKIYSLRPCIAVLACNVHSRSGRLYYIPLFLPLKCDNNITLYALKSWRNGVLNEKCLDLPSCYDESYTLKAANSKSRMGPKIIFFYHNPIIEHHFSYVSYDAQTLIGEIGGTLGLTLGLSGLTVIDVISSFLNRFLC